MISMLAMSLRVSIVVAGLVASTVGLVGGMTAVIRVGVVAEVARMRSRSVTRMALV